MMSVEQIRSRSREAAARAAREDKRPYIVEAEDLAVWKANGAREQFPFPFIGFLRVKGYKKTPNLYFVDASGLGEEGEAALTAKQFIEKLVVGCAYAIVEAGQFQVYVQEYLPVRKSVNAADLDKMIVFHGPGTIIGPVKGNGRAS